MHVSSTCSTSLLAPPSGLAADVAMDTEKKNEILSHINPFMKAL